MQLRNWFFSLNILFLIVFCINCTSSSEVKNKVQEIRSESDSSFDVFLIAGQSNTYWGMGYDTALDKKSVGIYQLGRYGSDNYKVIEASEPLQHFNPKPERIGFALTFAKLYQKATKNKHKILLIPCGMDNTGFEGDGWNKGNFLYVDAVERANYVFQHYPKSSLIAILWHQGEKDANYKKYQNALDTFIVQIRSDIKAANQNTPFILGGMVPYWTDLKESRKKQQVCIRNTTKRLPNIGYADPYLPTRIQKQDNNQDTVHFNAAGQREMAKRYFEAYKQFNKINKQ